MAYAAVTSLYHTIDLLLSSTRTSIDPSSQKTLKDARWVAERLQGALRKYDNMKNSSDEVLSVDARIRDEARKLEEAIESHASSQFLSQSQSHGRFALDLRHLSRDDSFFLNTAQVMSRDYLKKLYQPSSHTYVVPISTTSSNRNLDGDMVGFADLFLQVRGVIAGAEGPSFKCIAITGMAGIGKTTFVNKLFHDALVTENFKDRVYVRVGQKYDFKQILRDIATQLNVTMITEGHELQFLDYFSTCLTGRKFLIVLDDVWDGVSKSYDYGYERYDEMFNVWNDASESYDYDRKYLLDLVARDSCGACVLLTSRIDGIKYHTSLWVMVIA